MFPFAAVASAHIRRQRWQRDEDNRARRHREEREEAEKLLKAKEATLVPTPKVIEPLAVPDPKIHAAELAAINRKYYLMEVEIVSSLRPRHERQPFIDECMKEYDQKQINKLAP